MRSARFDDEEAWQGDGLVFVGGHPRSGTTFLGRLLGHHPSVAYWEEPQLLRSHSVIAAELTRLTGLLHVDARVVRSGRTIDAERHGPPIREQFGDGVAEHVPHTEDEALAVTRALLADLVAEFREISGRPVVCDKTPKSEDRFEFGMRLLPEARFVQIIRDPRDIACSTLSWVARAGERPRWLPLPRTIRHLPGASRVWSRHGSRAEIVGAVARQWTSLVAGAMELERTAAPDRLLTLRYEQLMADPHAELERLLAFLDLPWLPEVDEFLERGNGGGLDASSVGRWHTDLDRLERTVVERLAGPVMREVGYLH